MIAVDPGPTESAFVEIDDWDSIVNFGKISNDAMLGTLSRSQDSLLVIEMIASYGMAVGAEVFDTCVWIGRFHQAWAGPNVVKIFRREVKMALCGDSKAKDANIRQSLIDRFGGKDSAIGNKKNPGPLYGITADVWSALAVAITWQIIGDRQRVIAKGSR